MLDEGSQRVEFILKLIINHNFGRCFARTLAMLLQILCDSWIPLFKSFWRAESRKFWVREIYIVRVAPRQLWSNIFLGDRQGICQSYNDQPQSCEDALFLFLEERKFGWAYESSFNDWWAQPLNLADSK